MKTQEDGFTIVELLIVIVVIGILAAISIVAYNGVQARAMVSTAKTDIRNIGGQISMSLVDSDTLSNATIKSAYQAVGIELTATAPRRFIHCYNPTTKEYAIVAMHPVIRNSLVANGDKLYAYANDSMTEFTYNTTLPGTNVSTRVCAGALPSYTVGGWSHNLV